jgi:threonine dehydrogenase-like Zn-dependent dehydrogenase
MEAHVTPMQPDTVLDRVKQMMMMESDRPHVLREMIYVCRPGGVLSIPGVYSGLIDKVPMGQLMNKGAAWSRRSECNRPAGLAVA